MTIWKTCLYLVLTYALGAFYSTLVVIYLLIRTLINGKEFLATKPRKQPPPILSDPSLGKHNFAKLSDIKIHYVEAGNNDNPLLLFVHGFPDFWYTWRHQIKEFSKDYWVVAVDMRGYGETDKPKSLKDYKIDKLVQDLAELVEALGRKSCTLIAHDWGGLIAWSMAQTKPEMVDKFIALNTCTLSAWRETVHSSLIQFLKSWYVFFFHIPFIPEIAIKAGDYEALAKMYTRIKQPLTNDELEAYKYTLDYLTGPLNYYRNVSLYSEEPPPNRVPMPVLVIWGKKDAALEPSLAHTVYQFADNAKVKMIDEASHFVHTDAPAKVNEYIREFLENK